MSIRKFVFLWMSGLVLCFIGMAVALVMSTDKLQSMTARILDDARAIELAHQLEIAVLEERRADLLWRVTSSNVQHEKKNEFLGQATTITSQLEKNDIPPEEAELLAAIEVLFSQFKTVTMADQAVPIDKITDIVNQLLASIEQYREINRGQMTETLSISNRLNLAVDRWSILLIGFVFLIVLSGSVLLVKRILLPTVALSQATARFGRGESDIRVQVFRNDELGTLCGTFNTMAENINTLQQERLNFIAAVAHDLKNPLVLVGGTARRLKKKLTMTADQAGLVERLIEQTERMEDLIGELTDSVQTENGRMQLDLAELDLCSLVSAIQRHQDAMISSHQIVFQGDCPGRILGDARRLERVVGNLISNAVKYSGKNSRVLITTKQQGDKAVISVIDEGVGIPAADIARLFQPFTRLSHTREMAKGTGLGLYSVKKIIDSHGGSIAISSEPGEGTTVTIALPIVGAGGNVG